jgi:superfamily II DNA or RNA helicase
MKDADEVGRLAQNTVREDLELLLKNPQAVPATRLLATLIAAGVIDVRIAFSEDTSGMFHDKLGIFEDEEGRRVSFHGSANETWRAWGVNHESFSVFASWSNEPDLLRTREHADMFQDLWLDQEPTVRVARLDEVTAGQLREIADSDLDEAVANVRSFHGLERGRRTSRALMEHQSLVLEDWEAHGFRGIVNFATGAGKTLTAIEAVKRWTDGGRSAIIMVPGRDLHQQWINELETELPNAQILPIGAGHSKQAWVEMLPAFTDPAPSDRARRIVVTTNASFASLDFQRRLKAGDHILVVADEMHRVGSARVLPALESTSVGATLGLSATYRRQFDDQGTQRLEAFFGEVLTPQIGLAEALMLGLLVPYDYRLHEVQLDDEEQEEYDHLTKRIGALVAQGVSITDEDGGLRHLLIRRARILKQAKSKVPKALEILANEYVDGDRWLVYCDDLGQLKTLIDLCLDADLPALEFHSEMSGDRVTVLKSLANYGGIVVAIRCLDEGVDIPVTDHALILASSTVEREYIQRRGRVLRSAPGTFKVSAEVHDLILVDQVGGALTRGEATRALEFSRLARNDAARDRLKSIVGLSKDPIELPEFLEDEEKE